MLEQLKSIILDFQEIPLHPGIPRRLKVQPVPGKASICIGVRRSGKSTYLHQRMQQLVEAGVARQNILYLNFFDDRLSQLAESGLGPVLEAYFSIFPEKKGMEKVYCFFDEIQAIPNWEPFMDRLLRTENCAVWLTGSSARMLSKEMATQMRGRALSWEVFPFSFQEFLDSRGLKPEGALSTKKRLLAQKAFDEFWERGGFPETINLPEALRIKIHQEYFHAVLFRDLVERHDIPHPRAVSDLARQLMDNAASLYTINSLTGTLKSRGHKAPKSAVSDYLEWFEDAYFLFTVKKYDASLNKSNASPKKIYCVDHAMITSVASGILVNSGHLLENLVFNALRRASPQIYYYKTRNNKEVDFLILHERGERQLIQVCETLADPKTRKRELDALAEAMRELELKNGLIVTRHEEGKVSLDAGTVEIVPAWRFCLLP
ncbi:MAG: ATP-binding protein [Deltaproteobacteria bacterium]|jgi:predicted AAA+ superfamily ATPase|nr:ATP-binding protein [Deltaproteobacteria bacterium]